MNASRKDRVDKMCALLRALKPKFGIEKPDLLHAELAYRLTVVKDKYEALKKLHAKGKAAKLKLVKGTTV